MNELKKTYGRALQKALSVLCLLCLLLSFATVTASAQGTGKLTVSSSTAEKDTTVSVSVNLEANPGMYSLILKIGYDSSALTLKSAANGSIFPGSEVVMGSIDANPFTYTGYAAGVQNVTGNGTVVTLSFTVKKSAANGSYPVTVTQATGYDVSYNKFSIPASNGSITVADCIHSEKEWLVTKAAECESAGTETQTCKKCGKTFETRAISATGHKNTEIRGAVAATKSAAGYTGDTYCKDCGKLISKGKTIAKLTESSKPGSTSSSNSGSTSSSKPNSTSSEAGTSSEESSSQETASDGPKITTGENLVFDKSSGKSLVFISDADLSDFIRAEIDGKTLEENDYTTESGSTILTVSAECLGKLTDGKHSISIVSATGTATASFTVKDTAETVSTGDETEETGKSAAPVIIFIILAVLLVAGAVAFVIYKERGHR